MAEYIDRQELIENLNKFAPEHYNALVNQLIIKQPTADVVSKKVFEQVKWERDTAIEQLWTHGIALCEKKELAEVKHGEWIEKGYTECVCSLCGAEAPYKANCKEKYDYDYNDDLIFIGIETEKEYIKTPYCPNCGADMKGR